MSTFTSSALPAVGLHCALALITALLPAIAFAQEAPQPAAVAQDRYRVEIVVFRYPGDDTGPAHDGAMPAAAATPDEPVARPADGSWTMLAPTELRLGGSVARLRSTGDYRLLYHGGWAQDVGSRARAAPFPMPPEAQAAGVTGTITLYRERFPQVRVDLRLAGGGSIQQARRLRGQALQYFDDPRFGLILSARALDDTTADTTGPAPLSRPPE